MKLDNLIVRGYSLSKEDIALIERKATELSRPNISEALRLIIREWAYFAEQRRLAERPEYPQTVI